MKSKAEIFKTPDGWKMTDGISTGYGNTPEAAKAAYDEAKAFRPTITQDTAYELLEELEAWVECIEGFTAVGNKLTPAMQERLDFTKREIAKARGAA